MKNGLTLSRLKYLLNYDPVGGIFTWKRKTGSKAAGSVAGTQHKEYIRIQVGGMVYRAHRLAWFYMTGQWPAAEIDHINTVGSDNRWQNLRPVDHFINMQNQRRAHKNSATGLLGAYQQDGKYRSKIWFQGKPKSLGMFSTAQQAHAAYVAAKRTMHKGGTL